MKLKNVNDCTADTEARRLRETKLLQKAAYESGDPILLMTCELDAQARLLGYHIEYDSDYDDDIDI